MSQRQSSLWDSDGDDDISPKVVNLGSSKSLVSKKSTLFDSDSDDAITTIKNIHIPNQIITSEIDYKRLYEDEAARNKELETIIARLQGEIVEMQKQMSILEKDNGNGTSLLSAGSNQAEEDHDADATRTAEWEALAKEEKQRRQQKLRAMQAKQRAANANKRLGGGSSGGVAFVQASTDASIVQSASTGSFSTLGEAHDSAVALGDNEGGTEAIGAKPSPAAAASHYLDSSDEDPSDRTPMTASPVPPIEEEEGGAGAAEDPEAAKWRELAAQERLRKAQARRSVRVVRRDIASGAGEEGGGSAAPVAKHRHLRRTPLAPHSSALHSAGSSIVSNSNIAAEASAIVAPTRTAQVSAGASKPSSFDSGWEDSSSNESSGFSSTEEAPTQRLNSVMIEEVIAQDKKSSACIIVLSAGEEAEMDSRLRRWAAGRGIAALLASTPSALLNSVEEVCMAELRAAVAVLAEGGGSGDAAADIRRAYM